MALRLDVVHQLKVATLPYAALFLPSHFTFLCAINKTRTAVLVLGHEDAGQNFGHRCSTGQLEEEEETGRRGGGEPTDDCSLLVPVLVLVHEIECHNSFISTIMKFSYHKHQHSLNQTSHRIASRPSCDYDRTLMSTDERKVGDL